jgi:hypothetical protein
MPVHALGSPTHPASVVTMPLGATRRIMWLPKSLTNAYAVPPTAPVATATGEENRAAVPTPSAHPEEDPARVVTG